MSTSVTAISPPRTLPGRRYDRVFFPILSVLIFAAVFLGFAKTYFLAGMLRAPLPSSVVHIHGAIFTSWIILLIVQTGLVSARRLDLHKKLGLFAFALSCLMVTFGLLAARDSLLRSFQGGPGTDPRTFFILPVTDMFVFATLIYFAWALRTNGAVHKRLIMLATIALLDAAVSRWPFAFIASSHHLADLCVYAFLALLAAYDLWSTHKVHRVTVYGSLFIIVVQQIRIPIGMTHPWLRFADLVAGKY